MDIINHSVLSFYDTSYNDDSNYQIPNYYHFIWMNDSNNFNYDFCKEKPSKCDALKKNIYNIGHYDKSAKIFFWTNNKSILSSQQISTIKYDDLNIANPLDEESDLISSELTVKLHKLVQIGSFASLADIIRILVLYKYGGVYIDTGIILYDLEKNFANIDVLRKHYNFVGFENYGLNYEMDVILENFFIFASSNHIILENTINVIKDNLRASPDQLYIDGDGSPCGKSVYYVTGPVAISRGYMNAYDSSVAINSVILPSYLIFSCFLLDNPLRSSKFPPAKLNLYGKEILIGPIGEHCGEASWVNNRSYQYSHYKLPHVVTNPLVLPKDFVDLYALIKLNMPYETFDVENDNEILVDSINLVDFDIFIKFLLFESKAVKVEKNDNEIGRILFIDEDSLGNIQYNKEYDMIITPNTATLYQELLDKLFVGDPNYSYITIDNFQIVSNKINLYDNRIKNYIVKTDYLSSLVAKKINKNLKFDKINHFDCKISKSEIFYNQINREGLYTANTLNCLLFKKKNAAVLLIDNVNDINVYYVKISLSNNFTYNIPSLKIDRSISNFFTHIKIDISYVNKFFDENILKPVVQNSELMNLESILYRDINGDGVLELIQINQNLEVIICFQNDLDGSCLKYSKFNLSLYASKYRQIYLEDFNGDGKADILMYTDYKNQQGKGGTLTVFHGNGEGGFIKSPFITPSSCHSTYRLQFECPIGFYDFNKDGFLDILIPVTFHTFYILAGSHRGEFIISNVVNSKYFISDLLNRTSCFLGNFLGNNETDIAFLDQNSAVVIFNTRRPIAYLEIENNIFYNCIKNDCKTFVGEFHSEARDSILILKNNSEFTLITLTTTDIIYHIKSQILKKDGSFIIYDSCHMFYDNSIYQGKSVLACRSVDSMFINKIFYDSIQNSLVVYDELSLQSYSNRSFEFVTLSAKSSEMIKDELVTIFQDKLNLLTERNQGYLTFIDQLITQLKIKSILDYGCGDLQFMKYLPQLNQKDFTYIGADIVEEVILRNKEEFKDNPTYSFYTFNGEDFLDLLNSNPLIKADMIIVKDVFIHSPNRLIQEFITDIAPRFQYTLIINDIYAFNPEGGKRDIEGGEYRRVELLDGSWKFNDNQNISLLYIYSKVKGIYLLDSEPIDKHLYARGIAEQIIQEADFGADEQVLVFNRTLQYESENYLQDTYYDRNMNFQSSDLSYEILL